MPERNQAALDFLLTRRSRPAKTLAPVAPDTAEMRVLLTAAARTPDHGKLAPFRFVVVTGAARTRLAAAVRDGMEAAGEPAAQIDKQAAAPLQGGAMVAVIASPKPSDKIPLIEQHMAAAGACLALLNAALASGWGANWLTGWAARDRAFGAAAFDLKGDEFVAGFIHIGGETVAPADRPRPDLDRIVDWMDV